MPQKWVLPDMHLKMSQKTRVEILTQLRQRYRNAGREHKGKLLDQAVELLGCHRKAAIRALRLRAAARSPTFSVMGRPRQYDPARLLEPLKAIWLAGMQPCGRRLVAMLPQWVAAHEADQKPLDGVVRQQLLAASHATLERLLQPLRGQCSRRRPAPPGTLLRQQIPLRTEWSGEGPGYLEIDTVALCGGILDDRHLWLFDSVDIATTWVEMRALANRGQATTLEQINDVEARLPFALLGLDSDNGSEFINHHYLRQGQGRTPPVRLTRSRPYRKNDNAHIEQKNYTHVRQGFGHQRYDNPAVVGLINHLCKGALGQLLNFFLPTLKLESKSQEGGKIRRVYGVAQTPLARVLQSAQVTPEKKAQLQRQHAGLNPFVLRRQIERELKAIEQARQIKDCIGR